MILAAKPDVCEANPQRVNKAVWIGLIVLGFIVWWPFALALLAYLFWSGKMRCCHTDDSAHPGPGFWKHFYTMSKGCCGSRHGATSTGNTAFDEYRKETLRRLEEDQREFIEFLDRLRRARDRAEFDQFMAERNRRPNGAGPAETN